MAQVYLDSMYQGFQTSGHMIEKYNALAPGLAGYGGVSPAHVPDACLRLTEKVRAVPLPRSDSPDFQKWHGRLTVAPD